MDRKFDRGAAILLAIFAFGHGVMGTLLAAPFMDQLTLWSFSGSVAAWAIAILNWLRAGRPGDRPLAAWALVGALVWIVLMVWLMAAMSMWVDVRPWLFIAACAVLAWFGIRDLRRKP